MVDNESRKLNLPVGGCGDDRYTALQGSPLAGHFSGCSNFSDILAGQKEATRQKRSSFQHLEIV
jgi:hypothetical protein